MTENTNPQTGNIIVDVNAEYKSEVMDGYIVEASSIGLPPGNFPKELDLRIDHEYTTTLYRSNAQFNDDDELMMVTYRNPNVTSVLLVLND